MNIILWIFQIALALLAIAGGSYKVFEYEELAKVPAAAALPHAAWAALGMFEMICAVALLAPLFVKRMRSWAAHAALGLAVENFALAAIDAHYSLAMVATNPLVWTLAMGVLAVLVAIGRYSSKT